MLTAENRCTCKTGLKRRMVRSHCGGGAYAICIVDTTILIIASRLIALPAVFMQSIVIWRRPPHVLVHRRAR